MITINKWFSKNAKYPLLILGLATIFVQLCFIAYIFISQTKGQISSIENLFTVANLALEQKNRPVLESTFNVAIEDLGTKNILLCKGPETIMALPLGPYNCSQQPEVDLLTRKIKFNAIGRPDYQFYFFLPVLHLSKSYMVLFGITLMFFILSIAIILKVQRRLSKDILYPLENNLLSENSINIVQLERLRNKIKEVRETKEKEAAANAILEHKAKVAHNIRSLVQTLKTLQSSIQERLTPTKKALFNDVVEGIGDILTEFSTKTASSKQSGTLFSTEEAFFNELDRINEKRAKVEASDIIKSVAKQKRYELKSMGANLSLYCHVDSDLLCTFIDVHEREFRSILSNVINNAFESQSDENRKIWLDVTRNKNSVEIRIKDNGLGIPDEIRETLFNRGVTLGKQNGTGYGLFHAKAFLNSWGGSIEVETSSGEGTTFLINVPQWKPDLMALNDGDTIVILDDDPFIHETWKKHLVVWAQKTKLEINVKYFSDPKSVEQWISEENIDYSKTYFLIDNDLGEDHETGSQLIYSLGIAEISKLVTNRYDDKELGKFCKTNNISLLPKPCLFEEGILFVEASH